MLLLFGGGRHAFQAGIEQYIAYPSVAIYVYTHSIRVCTVQYSTGHNLCAPLEACCSLLEVTYLQQARERRLAAAVNGFGAEGTCVRVSFDGMLC